MLTDCSRVIDRAVERAYRGHETSHYLFVENAGDELARNMRHHAVECTTSAERNHRRSAGHGLHRDYSEIFYTRHEQRTSSAQQIQQLRMRYMPQEDNRGTRNTAAILEAAAVPGNHEGTPAAFAARIARSGLL